MPSWIVTEPLPSGVLIRDATRADLHRLIELLTQLSLDEPLDEPGPPPLPSYHAALEEILSDPRQRLLVVETSGRVVGTLVVVIVPNLTHQGQPYAIIENVVVDPRARGSGYGGLLIKAAIEIAREAGCYKVSLTSNKRRSDAHRFYERLGFEARHEGFRLDL